MARARAYGLSGDSAHKLNPEVQCAPKHATILEHTGRNIDQQFLCYHADRNPLAANRLAVPVPCNDQDTLAAIRPAVPVAVLLGWRQM